MNAKPECFPCMMNIVFESIKLATSDEALQKSIYLELSRDLSIYNYDISPPEIVGDFYRKLKKLSGNQDPYAFLKKIGNDKMMHFMPLFREKIKNSLNPLLIALELSIYGNIIDYGVAPDIDIEKTIDTFLEYESKVIGKENSRNFAYIDFVKDLSSAKTLLFIADNCGEIILDMLLLEQIKSEFRDISINIAVREEAILNDVTIEDAIYCSLDKIGYVFKSGSYSPGTLLKKCNHEFMQIFNSSDIVIRKGQGNFEALEGNKNRDIYYLFMAKCDVVTNVVSLFSKCNLRDILLIKNC